MSQEVQIGVAIQALKLGMSIAANRTKAIDMAGRAMIQAPQLIGTVAEALTLGDITGAPSALLIASLEPDERSKVTAVAITAGGTGYTVGDVLTLPGVASDVGATITVATAPGGVIATVTITTAGSYVEPPTGAIAATGGTGTGATFTPTFGALAANYVEIDSANTFDKFPQKLLPGRPILLAPQTGTIYAKANTAAVWVGKYATEA